MAEFISANSQLIAIIIFAVTYLLMMILPKVRPWIAVGGAVLFVALGILPIGEVLSSIDWNVIMMIAGTMGTVYLFIDSKMPDRLSDMIISRMPNVKWAVVILSFFAGLVSAFVDNVATVLMIAPVAVTVAKRLKISPVPLIICIAISSNLQGAATLVGDTTSILLAKQANLDFMDFFFVNGRPGMFWVVELGAVVATAVIYFKFRKENKPIDVKIMTEVRDYFPTVLLIGTVVLLIAASFIPYKSNALPGGIYKPDVTNGLICMAMFLIGVVRELIKSKDLKVVKSVVKEIDYFTIILLMGLFVVIGGINRAGVIELISDFIAGIGGSPFLLYTVVVWFSVLFSAFIDNIPYTATMLPVMAGIASILSINPNLLYFGLLTGATLGGNITPIGASANITGIGILRKEGYEVKNGEFMKYSVPITIAAVVTGYLLVWFIWA